jgi:3-hydroxybutyryl-CoA dehydrogenase
MKITKNSKVRVVGVGKVGMSLVQALAQSGFSPVGVDISEEQIKKGMKELEESLAARVNKGKLTTDQKKEILSKIKTSSNFDMLKDADVVIEAVFENMNVKKDLLRKVSGLVSSETLILTNTSSLSVSELGSVISNPRRFAGMHFFIQYRQ